MTGGLDSRAIKPRTGPVPVTDRCPIHWALTAGQAAETALGYAPLPTEIAQKALDQLHLVTTGGSPIWP